MIVQLPLGRLSQRAERIALTTGAFGSAAEKPLRLVDASETSALYCASCAAPIEFGAVWRAEEAFCSVECSLGGDRPA